MQSCILVMFFFYVFNLQLFANFCHISVKKNFGAKQSTPLALWQFLCLIYSEYSILKLYIPDNLVIIYLIYIKSISYTPVFIYFNKPTTPGTP
jgi:hypothetical protein